MSEHIIEIKGKSFEKWIDATQIEETVTQMAAKINAEFSGQKLTIICVLDGAFVFAADLVRKLTVDLDLEFIRLKSYDGMQSTGAINQLLTTDKPLDGHNILILEDIVDTGQTLHYLLNDLKQQQPRQIKIAALLLKPESFHFRYEVHYVGVEIPNHFVIGYGMDFDGEGRQLPHIYTLKA